MLLHKSAFKGIPSYFLQKNGKCPERYLEGVYVTFRGKTVTGIYR